MNKRALQIHLAKYPLPTEKSKGFWGKCDSGNCPKNEFHILASFRKKYDVDESLFTISGNVIFPNYRAVRVLVQKMNSQRDLQRHPEQTIRAGQLNAMGLIDEIFHYVLRLYEETANPGVFSRARSHLHYAIGSEDVRETIQVFGKLFPPMDVYRGNVSLDSFLKSDFSGKVALEIELEEIMLLYFANVNPAFAPFRELFTDEQLKSESSYGHLVASLEKYFQNEKRFGPQHQFIFDLLRAPILASPNNLEGQLEYIRKHWGLILSEKYLRRILGAGDLMKEDTKLISPGGTAPTVVPTYSYNEIGGVDSVDLERFTSDLEWMPKVVILAKNTYVWLDQLSKKYKRSIARLNEMPDEELDLLAQWNFTGLWLIGIWERSPASQKIKQMTGNPEAVSSAYSVYEYEIANDLGGEDAFKNLRYRAWQRGIRLAGDMVPNHVGIYSKWVIEHPEYFIQSSDKPFPGYQFSGPNLSSDQRVDIRIEDGYWSRKDAAVVFQRVDHHTGEVRYIYHGNDGTHMPWNDTAQLNFLQTEVREAVIQMIFHVARNFPIVRFDAAMTLTKRHFQRLWYPRPGSGGDIPSRADYALSSEEFNRLFPHEFWREVVDRINEEMPNTLLLAEAFWLLEGYFVRTLGMHRVYNSAFMHMLTREENAKYRELIKNTLAFNPEILKRYVNFMSNPDEQTAIAQFGKDDKYFGVALMMVTLPGLPMFAHGQIEGFTEKYGMEYKRAYYDETPDKHLIRRHEHELFPLMRKRHLFSQVTFFELYDFIDTHGNVNENVFAYSNKAADERALICYHNKYEETAGWIKSAVGKITSTFDGTGEKIAYKTLGNALDLKSGEGFYYIFKDYKSNLEYIRSGRELHEHGLYVELKAFHYHIFLDFREMYDTNGEYEQLAHNLQGKGVIDIQEELWEVRLSPVFNKLSELVSGEILESFRQVCFESTKEIPREDAMLQSIVNRHGQFVQLVKVVLHSSWEVSSVIEEFHKKLLTIHDLSSKGWRVDGQSYPLINFAEQRNILVLFSWVLINTLQQVGEQAIYDRLRLGVALRNWVANFNFDGELVEELISLIRLLISDNFFSSMRNGRSSAVREFFSRSDVHEFIKLHYHEDLRYFNKERFETVVNWLFMISVIENGENAPRELESRYRLFQRIIGAAEESKYQFEDFQRIILREGG